MEGETITALNRSESGQLLEVSLMMTLDNKKNESSYWARILIELFHLIAKNNFVFFRLAKITEIIEFLIFTSLFLLFFY